MVKNKQREQQTPLLMYPGLSDGSGTGNSMGGVMGWTEFEAQHNIGAAAERGKIIIYGKNLWRN